MRPVVSHLQREPGHAALLHSARPHPVDELALNRMGVLQQAIVPVAGLVGGLLVIERERQHEVGVLLRRAG